MISQLRYAAPLTADPLPPAELAERLRLVAAALRFFDFHAARHAVERAAADTGDAEALFQAGYELIEIGLDQLAVGALAQALAIAPDATTVLELSAALSNSWCYGEAAKLLATAPGGMDESVLVRALYAHNVAMTGDFAAVAAVLPRLEPDEQTAALVAMAHDRYARYAALSGRLAGGDLRTWELTLHGTLVLTAADFGEDDMNGRFGALWESPVAFAGTLAALETVLAGEKRTPVAIAYSPDRDSEILARTLARHLSLSAAPITETTPRSETLVVAYEWPGQAPDALAAWSEVPGATLYGHVLDWTSNCWPAPDVAGMEAQYVYPPWSQRMRLVPGSEEPGEERRTEMIPADNRTAPEIAADLAGQINLSLLTEDERAGLAQAQELLRVLRTAGARCGLLTGSRQVFYAGGPVTSSRFI